MKSEEIMTKAVIAKGKKISKKDFEVNLPGIDNVLGCWVINHKFEGLLNNNFVIIKGYYDVNIWYSYDNNSKTNVKIEHITYEDNIGLNENSINDNYEVIVRCLNQPNVINVENNNNTIKLTIEKEMSVEIIGNKTVMVNVSNVETNYEELNDYNEINENYLDE